MATSSLFHDFTYTKEEDIKRLVAAIEESEKDPPYEPSDPMIFITDPDEIKAVFRKWHGNREERAVQNAM